MGVGMIETSELQGLASQLRLVRERERHNARGESISDKQRGIEALGLAIRIAEAVKANPDGATAFYREIMGEAP